GRLAEALGGRGNNRREDDRRKRSKNHTKSRCHVSARVGYANITVGGSDHDREVLAIEGHRLTVPRRAQDRRPTLTNPQGFLTNRQLDIPPAARAAASAVAALARSHGRVYSHVPHESREAPWSTPGAGWST